MKDLNIRQLQAQRDTYRHKAHQSGSECDWQRFRNVRNQLKKIIKETKKSFYQNALSSKRSKVVWSTIHRILYPNPKPINEDPEKLNVYFANLVEELTGRESSSPDYLTQIIDSMPASPGEKFQLRRVTYSEVKRALLSIRKDCSTGYDNISIRLLQPVLEFHL
jgi:hypothetical protein